MESCLGGSAAEVAGSNSRSSISRIAQQKMRSAKSETAQKCKRDISVATSARLTFVTAGAKFRSFNSTIASLDAQPPVLHEKHTDITEDISQSVLRTMRVVYRGREVDLIGSREEFDETGVRHRSVR